MLEFDIDNLTPVMRRMADFERDIQHPDLTYSVRQMARVWDQNFTSEGSMVGGWAELSPYTQKVREERGYNGQHPILQQGGSLRKTVITSLLGQRTGRTIRSKGIAMTSVYHGLRAVLNASGEKAQNQTGGKADKINGKRGRNIPARPFWFVDANVTSAATDGLQRWVTKLLGDYR